jgi:ribosomal protein L7/L12
LELPLIAIAAVVVVVVVAVLVLRRGGGGGGVVVVPPRPEHSAPGAGGPHAPGALGVSELLARGNKIGAIKLVREQTGLGLKEAKDYVDALEAGTAPALPVVSPPAPSALSGEALEQEARALVERGNKIGAIKLVREQTGLGLKESKDYVDRLG